MFELWDIDKRTMIRKQDVIFWEHELGHPSLKPTALTYGVSIYPQLVVTSAVAGSLVATEQNPIHTIPPPVLMPRNDIPLVPPQARQTIDKLAPEPKERVRPKMPNEQLHFIPWLPPVPPQDPAPMPVLLDNIQFVPWNPPLPPPVTHLSQWVSIIDGLDEHFMATLHADESLVCLPDDAPEMK